MSIERTAKGFRVRLGSREDRIEVGTFPTELEAQKREAAAVLALAGTRGKTLGEVLEGELTRRELLKMVRHAAGDRKLYDKHLAKDPITALPVSEVRRLDVLELVERLDAKLEYQSVSNVLTVLNHGFRAAINRELIAQSPATKLGRKRPARTEEPWTYATLEEQRRVLDVAGTKWGPIIAFAMTTGLRAGELVSLRLSDVHEEAEEPHVIVRYGGPPAEPTKNGRIRRVPLFAAAVLAVKAQKAILRDPDRINLRGLLFPTEREGSFRDPDHVLPWRTWDRIRQKAFGRTFRWHDLRHTCASSLVSGFWGRRWSLEEVCAMLGHSDIKVTQRYAHLAESALSRAARETPGCAHDVPEPPKGPAAQVRGNIESRLGDLNPRPAVYETARLALVTRTYSSIGHLSGTARGLLEAAAAGDEEGAALALEDLAQGVLAQADVRLALEILRGGPFVLKRGIELATLVLEGGAFSRKAGSR